MKLLKGNIYKRQIRQEKLSYRSHFIIISSFLKLLLNAHFHFVQGVKWILQIKNETCVFIDWTLFLFDVNRKFWLRFHLWFFISIWNYSTYQKELRWNTKYQWKKYLDIWNNFIILSCFVWDSTFHQPLTKLFPFMSLNVKNLSLLFIQVD